MRVPGTSSPLQNAMTVPNWNRCAQTMFDIMALLDAHRHITLTDSPPEEERQEEPEEGAPSQVWGNLGAFLERLDEEWNSSLKVGRRRA
jgi:translation initiation factor 3 subunit C